MTKTCAFVGNLDMDLQNNWDKVYKLRAFLNDLITNEGYNHFNYCGARGFEEIAEMALLPFSDDNPKLTESDIWYELPNEICSLPYDAILSIMLTLIISRSDLILFYLNEQSEDVILESYEFAKTLGKKIINVAEKIV